jgi:hypothetical protein
MYFAAANVYIDEVIAKQDLFSIHALALTAMYSFRADVS